MLRKLLKRKRSDRSRFARHAFTVEPLEDRLLLAVGQMGPYLVFDTELLEMSLAGPAVQMPLGSDPGNAMFPDDGGGLAADGGLPSIDGYSFVDSGVTIMLSSQRDPNPGPASLGEAHAFLERQDAATNTPVNGDPADTEINPEELDGELFFVDSFFDVFFDITVTDVDSRPGRDFAGQPDGASVTFLDNGPAHMQSSAVVPFDKDAPNYGLIPPPESAPYIGHFDIVIPLGGDINGNGENDVLKFTLVSHAAGDENRTFIQLPDGTVIDGFDSEASLDGAILDESSDPPFLIGLTGPTTATSTLVNPVKNPGFSYVDANNNQLFEAGTDVALVAGEVDDGWFNTSVPEGGYTTVIPGAGLVVEGGPISATNIVYRANGDLVINTDLDATANVRLISSRQSVLFDDPTVRAGNQIYVWARQDIVSTGDIFEVTGNRSVVRFWAGRDVFLQSRVNAIHGQSDVKITAQRDALLPAVIFASRDVCIFAMRDLDASTSLMQGGRNLGLRAAKGNLAANSAQIDAGTNTILWTRGNVSAVSSVLTAGTSVLVWALGTVDTSDSLLDAGTTVKLYGRRGVTSVDSALLARRNVFVEAKLAIDVSGSIIDAGWNVNISSLRTIDAIASEIFSGWRIHFGACWRISVSDARLEAERIITIQSVKGKAIANDALVQATGHDDGSVLIEAGSDIAVKRARIEANRNLTMKSRDEIFARESELLACGVYGRVHLRSQNYLGLWDAAVRAYQRIDIRSYLDDLDVRMASVAIADGSTVGDVRLQADEIRVQDADIAAPDDLTIIGTQVGTAAFIGAGTRPCP